MAGKPPAAPDPEPYVLPLNPSRGRGARAEAPEFLDRLRAVPAKNLVAGFHYTTWILATLDRTPWPYARPLGAYGNTEDEAAENLKLLLLDDLEGTGIHGNPAYQPHYDNYVFRYRLLPYWEKRT